METLGALKFGLVIAAVLVGGLLVAFWGYWKLLAKKENQASSGK